MNFPERKIKNLESKIGDQKFGTKYLESKIWNYLRPCRHILIMARGHNQYLGDGKDDGVSGAKSNNNNYMSDEKFVKYSRNTFDLNDDQIYDMIKILINIR